MLVFKQMASITFELKVGKYFLNNISIYHLTDD